MLFWVEGGPEDIALVAASQVAFSALENLAVSAADGRHALFGDRDLLEALESSGLFTQRVTAYLSAAARRMTQEGDRLRRSQKVRVSIVASRADQVSDGWRVPLNVFQDSDFLDVPVLLAENFRDAKFYEYHAVRFASVMLPGFVVKLKAVHGGGDQISEMLQSYSDQGAWPVFCVVDSDKNVGCAPLGEVARDCAGIIDKCQCEFRVRLSVIGARSVENLLCDELWEVVLKGMTAEHEEGRRLVSSMPDSVSLFLNIKGGDQTCRFYADGSLDRQTKTGSECSGCGDAGACEVLPSFGKKLIQRVIVHLSQSGGLRSEPAHWPAPLYEVAERAALFGLASLPMRI